MGRHRYHGRKFGWRLSRVGSVLPATLLVLIVLALVAPSTPVYAGLALVIVTVGSRAQLRTLRRKPSVAARERRETSLKSLASPTCDSGRAAEEGVTGPATH